MMIGFSSSKHINTVKISDLACIKFVFAGSLSFDCRCVKFHCRRFPLANLLTVLKRQIVKDCQIGVLCADFAVTMTLNS